MKRMSFTVMVLVVFICCCLSAAAEVPGAVESKDTSTPRGKSMGYTLDEWIKRYDAYASLLPNSKKIVPVAFQEEDGRLWHLAAYADRMQMVFMTDVETKALIGVALNINLEGGTYDDGVAIGKELAVLPRLMIWACDDTLSSSDVSRICSTLVEISSISSMEIDDSIASHEGDYLYSFSRASTYSYILTARLFETE